LLRQFFIFLIFISFTFSTIGEFVKICFEETELVKDLADSDDSERDDSEKEIESDKVFYDNISFRFQKNLSYIKVLLIIKNSHFHYSQLVYSILSPPPEI
jgi:hypothetical protein